MLPSKGSSRSPYIVRAYEQEPMTYLDLISRVTSYPRSKTRAAVAGPRRVLRTAQRFGADRDGAASAAAQRPAAVEPSPSFEYVLDRAMHLLNGVSEQLRPLLDAVSQDVSGRLVPRGYTHDPATLRTHHLGRWYTGWLGLQYEHRQISRYLEGVASNTDKARRYVASSYVRHGSAALQAQKEATKRTIQHYQNEFEAVAYSMARELEAARRDGQWHRVWTLERRLASTASMFLPSQPLTSVWHTLRNDYDKRITEISMSRMGSWDDSHGLLYAEDVETRGKINVVKCYQTIFNGAVYMNAKPWRGESPIFTVTSPTGTDKRFIVIRLDQRSEPSPLWPRVWKPIWRPTLAGRSRIEAGSEPGEVKGQAEGRTYPTPPGTASRFRMRKIIRAHKVPKTESKGQRPLDKRANSDVPEAWYGSLLSDDHS